VILKGFIGGGLPYQLFQLHHNQVNIRSTSLFSFSFLLTDRKIGLSTVLIKRYFHSIII